MTQLTETVRLETDGEIALVIVDNPPVNALSWHVRQGLLDGMTTAVSNGAAGIVLVCEGRTFIAGADISEFGGRQRAPASKKCRMRWRTRRFQ